MTLTPEMEQLLNQSFGTPSQTGGSIPPTSVGTPATEENVTKEIARLRNAKEMSQPKEEPGFFKSLGQSIVRPFAEVGTTASNIGSAAVKALQGDFPAAEKALERPREIPFVGHVEPLYTGKETLGEGVARMATSGLELGTSVIAPKLPAKSGTVLKGAGESLYKSAITPTVQEAERLIRYKAKNKFLQRTSNYLSGVVTEGKPLLRSDTALEKGIKGTESGIGIKAKRVGDKLWEDTIAPAVKASKEVVKKEELFSPIEKRIAETTEPGRKAALQEAFDAIKDDYKDISEFSLEQAQKLKSELDEFTPEKIFRGKNVANEYRTLQNDMANAVRQKTYDALSNQNIRKSYLDWANLKELQKIGVRAISESKFKGGFGSFWSGVHDMATVPIKTIGGNILYRVGNTLEFVGPKGIKKFGDFLASKGLIF